MPKAAGLGVIAVITSACSGANQAQSSYAQQRHYAPCFPVQCLPTAQYNPQVAHPQIPYNGANYQTATHTPASHAYGIQAPHQQAAYNAYAVPALRGSQGLGSYTYASLGAVHYETQSDLFGLQGRLGYQSNSILGAEIEASIGLSDDTQSINSVNTTRKIDYSAAAFGVARLDLSEKFNLLGRVGYHTTKISTNNDDGTVQTSESETDIGVAIGVGGEYAIGLRDSIRLDYTHYEFDNGSSDNLSIAYSRKF